VAAPLVTQAILLRATPYGESDRVVTLLGRSTGRVSALARGARKSLRRFSGGLGLGATGEAVLRERAGAELAALESFDVVEARHGLGRDLGRTAHAAYAAELCDRLCAPRHPEPEVYDWLERFLGLLDQLGAGVERLRCFELGLLGRLGLGPSWRSCVACGRADLAAETVRLQAARGGFVCEACGRQGTPIFPATRAALVRLAEAELEDAATPRIDGDVNAACRRVISELLALHVGAPLKSVAFIEKMAGHS
jgi:DNA repair protein RecO (recombination protein O)